MQIHNSIKCWADWETIEESAKQQLMNVQSLPILGGLSFADAFSIWYWVGLFHPELYLAHAALAKVVSMS